MSTDMLCREGETVAGVVTANTAEGVPKAKATAIPIELMEVGKREIVALWPMSASSTDRRASL